MHTPLLDEYQRYLRAKNYRERTIRGLLGTARKFIPYLEERNIRIDACSIEDAEEYREHLLLSVTDDMCQKYRPVSINRELSRVSILYRFFCVMTYASMNPFEHVERLMYEHTLPRNILTIDEMERLLKELEVQSAYDLHGKTVIELMYSTGMRIAEVQSLMREDIHTDESYMVVRKDKSGGDRIVILTDYARELVALYVTHAKEDRPFACRTLDILGRRINARLKDVCRREKLPLITSHSIRHSIATHLIKSGADIREVQEILGHKKIQNTEVYTRIFPEDLKEIVERAHPRERSGDETGDSAVKRTF